MLFNERKHSTFWDTLIFEGEEIDVFFPVRKLPAYRLRGDKFTMIDADVRILRQDVYEWCLENFGPEFNMDHPYERMYFNFADLPNMNDPKFKKLRETRYSDHRWCMASRMAIAFRDAKDAMLFKLTWCARGTP